MTIASGSPILAQDVIDAIAAKYPEYSGLVPGGLQGSPFVAGATTSTDPFNDTSQALATALALVATGLPARSKANVTYNSQAYLWQGDYLYTGETTGTNVRAASSWGTSTGIGLDFASALSAAGGTSHLATLASFYQVTGPFFGYDGILFQIFASTTAAQATGGTAAAVQVDQFTLTPASTDGSSSQSIVYSNDGVTGHSATASVSIALTGTHDNTCTTTTTFTASVVVVPPSPTVSVNTGAYIEGAVEGPGWIFPAGSSGQFYYKTTRQGTPTALVICVLNFAD